MTPDPFAGSFKITGKKVFIRLKNQVCDSSEELLRSELFYEILKRALNGLKKRNSILLKFFGAREVNDPTGVLLQRHTNSLLRGSKGRAERRWRFPAEPGANINSREPKRAARLGSRRLTCVRFDARRCRFPTGD